MLLNSRSLLKAFVALIIFAFAANDMMAQQTVDDVLKARGLNAQDKLAAVKTFMPRGGRDEYFSIVGTGNSGTMIVYGLPSMRIYKYVGLFSPEPWQGFGFDDESSLLLKKSSLDDRISTYGDFRYPAFSEKNGKYDGKYAFFSDGANSRVALMGLDDFETKQVLSNPLFVSCFPGVAVTQNTEYIVQTSQFPAPWGNKSTDMKAGMTFWSFKEAGKEGHHQGRILKDKSFSVELPAYTLGYFDAGKFDSDGKVVGLAQKDGKSFVYIADYKALSSAAKTKVNDFNVVTYDNAKGSVKFIELPAAGSTVKVTPKGKNFIVLAGNSALVYDFTGKQAGAVDFGAKAVDLAFDYRDGCAFVSLFDAKKVVRFSYTEMKAGPSIALTFKPGQLMTPQGLSAEPHSNYLVVVDKEGLYDNYPNVGPVRPSFQHLIDISSDNMKDIYTMSLPQANIYGSVAVKRTTIKPIIRYPTGTNSRTGEESPFKTVAGKEKIEREGNRVHVFGTMIRSHITPEIVNVNQGDIVTFHLTNLERAEDETHGFTIDTYGKHGSFEPGKTASLTFTADRAGIFPFYCTEFCSALHLEMEGMLFVKPANFKEEKIEDVVLTEAELAEYKKQYETKLEVIAQTQDIINGVVQWLKDNHFEKYPYVKALVDDAFDQLGKGAFAKENHEKYAKEGKYKDAFLWAEQYWQYQVKTADVGLRAKKLLAEKIGEKE
jgi:nitrous-oxide reductase